MQEESESDCCSEPHRQKSWAAMWDTEQREWPQGLAPHWADKGMVVVVSRGEMDALLKNLTAVWALI